MIAFFADNHFKARPGHVLHQKLDGEEDLVFAEDDLHLLPSTLARTDCRLLILNWISDTSGNVHPGREIEIPLKQYLQSGKPLLLLHGASAAFHRWDWWRQLVGHRWVRDPDPDGFAPSIHPVRPYSLSVAKTRHPLASQLLPVQLPEDEIYIRLEQTCPTTVLLETNIDEGTFPQAYLCQTPWNGRVAGFIPGHSPHVFEVPELVHNIRVLIRFLLASAPVHDQPPSR